MKKLVYGTAVAMTLALAFPVRSEAQSPPPVQPGAPAQTQAAPPPAPYVAQTTTRTVKRTTVRRRVRTRVVSESVANQLNAQELAGAPVRPAVAAAYGPGAYPRPVIPAAYYPPQLGRA